jgi:dolichol-phosphate mannosyltransferase
MSQDLIVCIPSFEPTDNLIKLVKELVLAQFSKIIIVNDGSADLYAPVFNTLSQEKNIILLNHEKNMGKGRAIKTALTYIQENKTMFEEYHGIITVDSDGQHLVKDILRLGDSFMHHNISSGNTSAIFLGTRVFGKGVPFKSKFGNTLTCKIFGFLSDVYISDTQTGLRVLPLTELDFFIRISGERFEYETNMLIQCLKNNFLIHEVNIETVYHVNHQTHFHPIIDSVRIYSQLISVFIKYSFVAIISAILDISIFAIFLKLVFASNTDMAILYSALIARLFSASINFTLNRRKVFAAKGKLITHAIKYIILCLAVAGLSSSIVELFYYLTGREPVLIKIMIDSILFIVNYRMQKRWVFK